MPGSGKPSAIASLLKGIEGRWSPDCKSMEGIKIDTSLKAVFTINSNQISINAHLNNDGRDLVRIYFDLQFDLGRGGLIINWVNFSKSIPIATININKSNAIQSPGWAGKMCVLRNHSSDRKGRYCASQVPTRGTKKPGKGPAFSFR